MVPGAHRLVGGDGGHQRRPIDGGEEAGNQRGQLFGWRGTGLHEGVAEGAAEGAGLVGGEPGGRGAEAAEGDGTHRLSNGGEDGAEPFMLELLRRGPLHVDNVALPRAVGLLDGSHVAGVDEGHLSGVYAPVGERLTKHGDRLKEVVDDGGAALERLPVERPRAASCEEEAVAGVEECEVAEGELLAPLPRGETDGGCRLRHLDFAARDGGGDGAVGAGNVEGGSEPFRSEVAAAHGEQERAVESGVAEKADVQCFHVVLTARGLAAPLPRCRSRRRCVKAPKAESRCGGRLVECGLPTL